MLTIVVRAIQSALAVIAAIATTSWLGEGNLAKLAAIPVASGAAILIEYLLVLAPKRSARIRRRLDPRSAFEGSWIQQVRQVATADPYARSNAFAVFTVTYTDGHYEIEGTAYDPQGREHSRWNSTDQVHFSPNGRALTYLWEGTLSAGGEDIGELERSGFCTLRLVSDNSGTGRVDHVSMKVTLVFNIARVTAEIAERWKEGADPASLEDLAERDSFARDYAQRLLAGSA